MTGSTAPQDESFPISRIAAAAGCSVQQVRDLERLGVIPAAQRLSNGYRLFSREHLVALRAYRNLALAVGPVEARTAIPEIRRLPSDQAVARIVAFHVLLARAREDILAAIGALEAIVQEQASDAPPTPEDTMSISELAAAIGVRTSTLRYWESEGLITPDRVTTLNVRRYPVAAIRDARIVGTLRAGGYPIPAIRTVLSTIHDAANPTEARAVLNARLEVIARQSRALLCAGADLVTLLPC